VGIPLRQYYRLLARYLSPQKRMVSLLGILIVANLMLQLARPQLLRIFVDTATGTRSDYALGVTALAFVIVALLGSALEACSEYVSETVGWTAANKLRGDLAAHCLALDMSFHKAHTPGELIERLDGDVTKLSRFFSQLVIGVFANALLLVGVVIVLFREDYRVGIGLGVFTLSAVGVLTYLRGIAVPYWAATRQLSGKFYGFLAEHLAGTEDIRANGARGYVMFRFFEQLRAWLPAMRKAYVADVSLWGATILTFALGNAIAFGLSAYLWAEGLVTIGAIFMIIQYTELLRWPIEQIRNQMQELQRAGASIARVVSLLEKRSRVVDGHVSALPSGPLSVELRGTSFSYEPDEDPVLQDITLRLEPGKVLGLLGRTGSGKTTLARLLLRLYDPTDGSVEIGGVSTRDTTLAALRSKVAFVTQDVQLFQATIRDNLTLFDPGVTDNQALAVLSELGLGAWLDSQPLGLDTVLAPGGAGMSAGEAQLLALARCFLMDPGLVVLDEASSRLDPATEHLLERAVTRLLANRTGVIIAHRLETVERADDILILEHGHVIEHGSRVDLLHQPDSRFNALLQTGLKELLV